MVRAQFTSDQIAMIRHQLQFGCSAEVKNVKSMRMPMREIDRSFGRDPCRAMISNP
jgi:hypothetical protein